MTVERDDFNSFIEQYKERVKLSYLPDHIVIDFSDLDDWNPQIARELLEQPDSIIDVFESATSTSTKNKNECLVSLKNIPTEVDIRELGSEHIGKLVLLRGVIDRVTPLRPMISIAVFKCKKCGEQDMVIQDESFMVTPTKCRTKKCYGKDFKFMESDSTFIDVEELGVEERPEDLPAGQLPRQVNLQIRRKYLINKARAGDIVNVVGVLRTKPTSPSNKKRIFHTFFEVNYIETLNKETCETIINDEEKKAIIDLSQDVDVYEKIVESIAPSIYGYYDIKEAITYLLFGGVMKEKPDIKIRGEINVLLIGDPALAKSQLLQATAGVSPRSIYCSGKGSTAAGLTATVNKVDDLWVLNAGALVLADKGIVAIDEIEKMNENDRVAIHEAMESGKISINKAGINATLNARTAMLAAANPDFGRYDTTLTVGENIKKLPVTLLSRFDLIFIMKDRLDKSIDESLSSHILGKKRSSMEVIDRNLLKKYIAYARINYHPKMDDLAMDYIQKHYMEIRERGRKNDCPVAITARQLESLVRITEAHAKIGLKDTADITDAQAAVNIMDKAFQDVLLDPDQKLDIDRIMGNMTYRERKRKLTVLDCMERGETYNEKQLEEMVKRKVNISPEQFRKEILILEKMGQIYHPNNGEVRRL